MMLPSSSDCIGCSTNRKWLCVDHFSGDKEAFGSLASTLAELEYEYLRLAGRALEKWPKTQFNYAT